MHPDQATEPILDFAAEAGKCFAVLPCCVFPTHFPARRVVGPDGAEGPVTSYRQLVQYIRQKTGGGEQILGFEGANRVVFTVPPN